MSGASEQISHERRVLAAALESPAEVLPILRAARLEPEEFASDVCRAGWGVVLAMDSRGLVPDVVAVASAAAAKLAKPNGEEGVLADFAELGAEPGTVPNVIHHLGKLRDFNLCRQADLAVARFREMNSNGNPRTEGVKALADDLRDLLESRPAEKTSRLCFRTVEELRSAPESNVEWSVEGLIAKGEATLLASAAKLGKTTLTAALLRALERGEPFAGFPTTRTTAVYLSEEPAALVLEKVEAFDLRSTVFLTREDFDPRLTFGDWIEGAAAEALRIGAGLLVVDTFRRFSRLGPDKEKDAGAVDQIVEAALTVAARDGLAVLILHHHRKAEGEYGNQIAGSNALVGSVDTIIELRRLDNERGPVRILECQGRHPDTPQEPVSIELRHGRFERLGSAAEVKAGRAREKVLDVLREASDPMTRDDLLDAVGGKRVATTTALYSLVEDRTITRTGKGVKNSPYLHFLSLGIPGYPKDGENNGQEVSVPLSPPLLGDREKGKHEQPSELFDSKGTGIRKERGEA